MAFKDSPRLMIITCYSKRKLVKEDRLLNDVDKKTNHMRFYVLNEEGFSYVVFKLGCIVGARLSGAFRFGDFQSDL